MSGNCDQCTACFLCFMFFGGGSLIIFSCMAAPVLLSTQVIPQYNDYQEEERFHVVRLCHLNSVTTIGKKLYIKLSTAKQGHNTLASACLSVCVYFKGSGASPQNEEEMKNIYSHFPYIYIQFNFHKIRNFKFEVFNNQLHKKSNFYPFRLL